MMKIRFFFYFSIFLVLACSVKAKTFKAEEFVLDNGLQVVVVENHKAPLIKHMVWYKVGAVDEYLGKGGSAHLLEHLMFRGTNNVSGEEFNQIMDNNGVVSNAFTSFDVTVYHQFADISRLEALMALEADRMRNLNFTSEDFAAEKKIVFQERKQVVENNPAHAYNEHFNLLFWGNSPYGRPITGLSEEIEQLKYKDTTDFYRRYYAPNNAILILSGDIDFITAKKLVSKYYGNIPAVNIAQRQTNINDENFNITLQMKLPEIASPRVDIRYMLPPHKQLGDKIYDYLVLAEYLGGGETSELYRNLVLEKKKAVSVSAGYNYVTRTNSVMAVSIIPSSLSALQDNELLQDFQEALQKARKELNDKRIEQIKRKMTADLIYMNDNPEDAANWIGYMLANDFSLNDVQDYEDKIKAVQKSGVLTALDSMMNASQAVGILLPEKGEN